MCYLKKHDNIYVDNKKTHSFLVLILKLANIKKYVVNYYWEIEGERQSRTSEYQSGFNDAVL